VFGLDERIAAVSDGSTLLLVVAVAIVVGLRHATDPDHLAALTTLIASGDDRRQRSGALGMSWGLGHATSLFAFGLPIVIWRSYLPQPVQAGAETAVGVLIVLLAGWLLVRWRRGAFDDHGPRGSRPQRTRRQAYAIGLVHGMGGSAGVGLLLLASIPDHLLAATALAVFAVFTAVSMTVASTAIGTALDGTAIRRHFDAAAPALGVASLAFGVWYALGALSLAPYGL
jgi:high-affinity nickel permease